MWVTSKRFEEEREKKKVIQARGRKKPEHKNKQRIYFQTYNQLPKQKAYHSEYYKRPEVRARYREKRMADPSRPAKLEKRRLRSETWAAKQASPEYIERQRMLAKKNYERKKPEIAAQMSEKRRSDPAMRLKQNVSRRIRKAMLSIDCRKDAPTLDILGCTIPDFRAWLERQFETGMTWKNYGLRGWNIDHIIPIARFPLDEPVAVRHAFNYRNCRPMWRIPNIAKGDKLDMALVAKHELWEWLPYVTETLAKAA